MARKLIPVDGEVVPVSMGVGMGGVSGLPDYVQEGRYKLTPVEGTVVPLDAWDPDAPPQPQPEPEPEPLPEPEPKKPWYKSVFNKGEGAPALGMGGEAAQWEPRPDGTAKGEGWLGRVPMKDGSGRVMTELSESSHFDGREVHYPLLVPTLTEDEIDHLAHGHGPTGEISKKAVAHAMEMMRQGKSPFKDGGQEFVQPGGMEKVKSAVKEMVTGPADPMVAMGPTGLLASTLRDRILKEAPGLPGLPGAKLRGDDVSVPRDERPRLASWSVAPPLYGSIDPETGKRHGVYDVWSGDYAPTWAKGGKGSSKGAGALADGVYSHLRSDAGWWARNLMLGGAMMGRLANTITYDAPGAALHAMAAFAEEAHGGESDPLTRALHAAGDWFLKHGDEAAKPWERAEELKQELVPEYRRGKIFMQDLSLLFNPAYVLESTGDALASMVPVFMAALTGGPWARWLGAFIGGTMEGGSLLREELEEGASPHSALIRGGGFGLATSYLNKIGIDAILGKYASSLVARFLGPFFVIGVEGGMEWTEEPTEQWFKWVGKAPVVTEGGGVGKSWVDGWNLAKENKPLGEPKDVLTAMGYAGYMGTEVILGAGLAGGAMHVAARPTVRQAESGQQVDMLSPEQGVVQHFSEQKQEQLRQERAAANDRVAVAKEWTGEQREIVSDLAKKRLGDLVKKKESGSEMTEAETREVLFLQDNVNNVEALAVLYDYAPILEQVAALTPFSEEEIGAAHPPLPDPFVQENLDFVLSEEEGGGQGIVDYVDQVIDALDSMDFKTQIHEQADGSVAMGEQAKSGKEVDLLALEKQPAEQEGPGFSFEEEGADTQDFAQKEEVALPASQPFTEEELAAVSPAQAEPVVVPPLGMQERELQPLPGTVLRTESTEADLPVQPQVAQPTSQPFTEEELAVVSPAQAEPVVVPSLETVQRETMPLPGTQLRTMEGVDEAREVPDARPGEPGLGQGDPGRPGEYAGPGQEEYDGRRAGGRAGEIQIPGQESREFQYQVMEAEEVVPSHDPLRGFQRNENYPYTNERAYHRNEHEQNKVNENARQLNIPLVVDESPTAEHGGPVVDRHGNVLGGNSRAMSLQVVYESSPENAQKYKQALIDSAEALGIDPQAVAKMNKPVLVRVDHGVQSLAQGQELIPALNESFTQEVDQDALGVSMGTRISDRSLNVLAAGMEEHGTLRAFLDSAMARSFVDSLVEDGAIIKSKLTNLYRNGEVTPEGKDAIERMVRGAIVADYDLVNALPPSLLNALDRSIPHLARLMDRGEGWDIRGELVMALQHVTRHRNSGSQETLDVYFHTPQMFGEIEGRTNPIVQILAHALDNMGPNVFGQAVGKYTKAAFLTEKGRGVLPGLVKMPTKAQALESFRHEKTPKGLFEKLDVPKKKPLPGTEKRTAAKEEARAPEWLRELPEERAGDVAFILENMRKFVADVKTSPDYDFIEKQRRQTLRNAREFIAFLEDYKGEYLETGHRAGQQIVFTGRAGEFGYREFADVSGPNMGRIGLMPTEEQARKQLDKDKKTAKDMQDGFKRLGELQRGETAIPVTKEQVSQGLTADFMLDLFDGAESLESGPGEKSVASSVPAHEAAARKPAPGTETRAEASAREAVKGHAKGIADSTKTILDSISKRGGLSVRIVQDGDPSIDQSLYAEIKPELAKIWNHLQGMGYAGKELARQFVTRVLNGFGEHKAGLRPYFSKFIHEEIFQQEDPNVDVQRTSEGLERDSQREAQEPVGKESVSQDRAGDSEGGVRGPQAARTGGAAVSSATSVSGREAVATRESSHSQVDTREPGLDDDLARGKHSERSDPSDEQGLAHDAATRETVERTLEQDTERRSRPVDPNAKIVPGDSENVAKTVSALFPSQVEDVVFAEQRFAKGAGVMFANGTGTGKTGVGGGLIKRMVMSGRDNILIVVPSQDIANAWVKFAKDYLGVEITRLKSTRDAGQGVVITTSANAGANDALATRQWDMIIADEAHKLSHNMDGNPTAYLRTLRALAMHPDGAARAFEMQHGEEYSRRDELVEKGMDNLTEAEVKEVSRLDALRNEFLKKFEKEAKRLRHENTNRADLSLKKDGGRPGVVFLSATPFAYELNVDYAEGFLFNYRETEAFGYNHADGRADFMIRHFGWRMRYGKLTRPDENVDSGLMQRTFNTWLRKMNVFSSRMLELDQDYDRRFILVDSAVGHKIDEGLDWLNEESRRDHFAPLHDAIQDAFAFHRRQFLLEAIKAKEAIPVIRKHIALGRKVVVFHEFKKGGGFHPFLVSNFATSEELLPLAREFAEARPDLQELGLRDLGSPLEALGEAFPDMLIINGDVSQADRARAITEFQDDGSGKNLVVVQSAAGEAGISLHDTTGKHSRVLINLGMPTRPVSAIQQEGRIFRVGQQSNAAFRYMNTGTNWERWTFGNIIAHRASAAENLALGEEARGLRSSFINAFEESAAWEPGHEGEGTGGKERDRQARQVLTDYERAKALYFAQEKKTQRTKSAEGRDYFATPEPLGLKMVEWAGIEDGMDALEPSAGHGAIARWLPEQARRTMIEPSAELSSRLALVTDGRIISGVFEGHNIRNKYDAIVMNPPFGRAGKTAMDHVAKAFGHLREGGRIVAIVPGGGAMAARMESWLASDQSKGAHVRMVVRLPAVTFSRSGTNVFSDLYIIDRASDPKTPGIAPGIEYSIEAETIAQLFDALEDMDVPERSLAVERARHNPGATIAESTGVLAADSFEHTKTRDTMYVAKTSGRLARDEYRAMADIAKKHGGYWSRFKKDGAIPGFLFKNAEAQAKFIEEGTAKIEEMRKAGDEPSIRLSRESVTPWPEGFPKAFAHTTVGKVTGHPDFEAAKGGDKAAARRLVNDLVKKDRLKGLAEQFPGAVLVPVIEVESSGNNAIPMALTEALVEAGIKDVAAGIFQTSKVQRKGMKAVERLKKRKVFEGEVVPGRLYIIVDDILTQGGTVHELRTHIVNNGGKVVAVSSLAFSAGSNIIAIQQRTVDEIVRRFGRERTEELLQEENITGIIEALTESEGRAILRFGSFESFRARITKEGLAGFSRRDQGETSPRKVGSLAVADVQSVVEEVTSEWINGPEVTVVDSVDALPSHIQEQLQGSQVDGAVEAVYHQGQVWVVADQMASVEDVQRVLAHEGVGHHGLRLIMDGKVLDHTLDRAWQNRAVRQEAEAIAKEYGLDLEDRTQRREAVEEVLAHWAGEGKQAGVVDRLVSAVARAVRRVFPSLKMTKAELRSLISQAKRAVEGGVSTEVQSAQQESRAVLSFVSDAMRDAEAAGIPITRQEALKLVYKNQSFVNKIFEGQDPAIYQAERAVDAMQKAVQRLAGSAKWKYNPLNIFSFEKEVKDTQRSRDLDYAMLVHRELQINPQRAEAFKEWAQDQIEGRGVKRAKGARLVQIKEQLAALELAENLTEEQKDFVDVTMDLAFANLGVAAQNAGLVNRLLDNYVRRLWRFPDDDPRGARFGTNHAFQTSTTASRARSLETIFDGWMKGYDLRVRGVTNSWHTLAKEIGTIMANKSFVQQGREIGLFSTTRLPGYVKLEASGFDVWARKAGASIEMSGPYGLLGTDGQGRRVYMSPPNQIWAVYKNKGARRAEALFDVNDLHQAEELLADLRSQGHGGAHITLRQGVDVFEKVPLYAPAMIADMANRVTRTLHPDSPWRASLMTTVHRFNASAKAWILVGNLFHHISGLNSWWFGVDHGAIDALRRGDIKGWLESMASAVNVVAAHKRGLQRIKDNEPIVEHLVRQGMQIGKQAAWSEGLLREVAGITEGLVTAMVGRVPGAEQALAAVKAMKLAREKTTVSLFNRFFAGLKVEVAVAKYAMDLKREIREGLKEGRDPDVDLAARRTAVQVNSDLGGQHYRRKGRHPEVQKFLQFVQLAPDWTESNWRLVTGTIPGLNDAIAEAMREMPDPPGMHKSYYQFWGRVITKGAILSALANMAIHGLFGGDDDDWKDFYKDQFSSMRQFKKGLWAGGIDLTPAFKKMGWELDDGQRMVFTLIGHLADPAKIMDPWRLLKHKAAPLPRIALNIGTGSDYRGHSYTGFKELVESGRLVKKSPFEKEDGFYNKLPSAIISSIKDTQAIPLSAALSYFLGEIDGFSSFARFIGARVRVDYMRHPIYDKYTELVSMIGDDVAMAKRLRAVQREYDRLVDNKKFDDAAQYKKQEKEAFKLMPKLTEEADEEMSKRRLALRLHRSVEVDIKRYSKDLKDISLDTRENRDQIRAIDSKIRGRMQVFVNKYGHFEPVLVK